MNIISCLLLLHSPAAGADITADTVWADSVRSSIITVADGILTILPGTCVDNTDLTVTGPGAVHAAGTAEAPVVFTGSVVRFDGVTRDSLNVFTHCVFRNRFNLVEFRTPADVREPSAPLFEDCVFRHGGYALAYITSGGAPTFRRCTFHDAGSGIFLHGGSRVTVESCVIYGTSCGIINATISGWYQHLTVDHCTIFGITGTRSYTWANGYGITNGNDPGTLSVANTVIAQTDGYGLHDGAKPWLVENDYNCYYSNGSGAANIPAGVHSLTGADPRFTDTTGGFFGLDDTSPCLNAASDGLHIGAWQGVPAGMGQGTAPGTVPFRISPHPCTGRTEMRLPLTAAGTMVTIINTAGIPVRTLTVPYNGMPLKWDGTGSDGEPLRPGIYGIMTAAGSSRIVLTR